MSKKASSTTSQTDWKRVDALTDEEINMSENPEVTPEMFAKGIVRKGLKSWPGKQQVTLRIDRDVLTWFKARGKGYQTEINTLLREYMKAHDPDKRPNR
ncbi:MAG TPA: hypothetical protein ENI99_02530 [Sedimenticola sp.]|nr:hypothetical protein [Sedimenticola sp.]